MVRRSVADDSYGRGPFARSIEFREIDSLPSAERDCAVAHRKSYRVANEHGLDMRGPVTFAVRVLRIARDRSFQCSEDVFLHVGVRVLVHEYRAVVCGTPTANR